MSGRVRRSTVEVDTYPGVQWTGTRRKHQPGIGLELLAAAGGEHQRQLGQGGAADSDAGAASSNEPGKPQLRVGMSVELSVETGHERGLPDFRSTAGSDASGSNGRRRLRAKASFRPGSIAPRSRPVSILAVIMQALDTTIANVALPYMQGSVSASADQINWVLTSYIVAAAIMTPPSGFLANRFGRQRVLMVAIAGFVLASMLCGIAQSLFEIVAFRLLQGFFGAALVPISQSILLDIYTLEERGSAMALFGVVGDGRTGARAR